MQLLIVLQNLFHQQFFPEILSLLNQNLRDSPGAWEWWEQTMFSNHYTFPKKSPEFYRIFLLSFIKNIELYHYEVAVAWI